MALVLTARQPPQIPSEDAARLELIPVRTRPVRLQTDMALISVLQQRSNLSFPVYSPQNPWFSRFLERLLENSPEVTALLGSNPFPHKPPTYIRTLLYNYRFSRPEEKKATGAWWVRHLEEIYYPPVGLHKSGTGRIHRLTWSDRFTARRFLQVMHLTVRPTALFHPYIVFRALVAQGSRGQASLHDQTVRASGSGY